jgi:hypothetical protein
MQNAKENFKNALTSVKVSKIDILVHIKHPLISYSPRQYKFKIIRASVTYRLQGSVQA